eukprot:TRINITY_DN13193_c0_g1_i1.p1 TRINITY_DN13193_c0_g1~~TRINITY_DN13193_c0_g1_i1.p1  ORF type:complete len:156 (+),score=17.64 TRINITY_DN13193_c0_g1_i1:269-736(+)
MSTTTVPPPSVTYMEHGNMTVKDVDATTTFLKLALPDFRVRGGGLISEGRPWSHVGNDYCYVALEGARGTGTRARYSDPGINHIAFVVKDLDALIERLDNAGHGYTNSISGKKTDYRRRVYYNSDSEGQEEWEFVEYLTDDVSLRNDYKTAEVTI